MRFSLKKINRFLLMFGFVLAVRGDASGHEIWIGRKSRLERLGAEVRSA